MVPSRRDGETDGTREYLLAQLTSDGYVLLADPGSLNALALYAPTVFTYLGEPPHRLPAAPSLRQGKITHTSTARSTNNDTFHTPVSQNHTPTTTTPNIS